MAGKGNELKNIILDVSQKLFSRFGFKKTTIDEIASSLNKTKSSIYHYFKSKEEIFHMIVKREGDSLVRSLEKAVKEQNSPIDKLKAYILTRMYELNKLGNYYESLRNDYYAEYGFIQKMRKGYDDFEMKTVKGILSEGHKKGVFEIENIDLAAVGIITALKGFEHPWATAEDVEEVKKNIESTMNVLFYGIVKR